MKNECKKGVLVLSPQERTQKLRMGKSQQTLKYRVAQIKILLEKYVSCSIGSSYAVNRSTPPPLPRPTIPLSNYY